MLRARLGGVAHGAVRHLKLVELPLWVNRGVRRGVSKVMLSPARCPQGSKTRDDRILRVPLVFGSQLVGGVAGSNSFATLAAPRPVRGPRRIRSGFSAASRPYAADLIEGEEAKRRPKVSRGERNKLQERLAQLDCDQAFLEGKSARSKPRHVSSACGWSNVDKAVLLGRRRGGGVKALLAARAFSSDMKKSSTPRPR